MADNVDPDQTAPLGPYCLLLYLIRQFVRQLFAADNSSRRHLQMDFFLGALRVQILNPTSESVQLHWSKPLGGFLILDHTYDLQNLIRY